MNTSAAQKLSEGQWHQPHTYSNKDEFIRKQLERQYQEATDMAQLIDIIELAKKFRYKALADQMINDLDETEKALWQMHERSLNH